ncbi:MAG TPA: hypothetical protein VGC76_08275 [Pyrinomonadaceae bacterium]|jgi:hypothetical protein
MNELEPRYEITRKDLAKNKALKIGAWTLPFVLSIIPALIFFFFFLLSSAPPTAAVWLFLSIASLIGGFLLGLAISGGLMVYRSRWLTKIRERIAVDGIKANEVTWFSHELTSAEKKSLKEIESTNLLLADAFRDTLAARLTATRILKASKQELQLVQRRQNKLKYLKSENSAALQNELKTDFEKLNKIKTEAEEMRVEAETRIQMIEAASRRGTNLADAELALKKLSARTQELPLALESAKMEEEIRKELEKDL